MATIDRPLSQPRTDLPETSRPIVKPQKPFFLRSWFAAVFVVLFIAAHVYGWYKAQIQPELLVTKFPDMQRLFTELLQPDIIAQDLKQLQVSLPIVGVEAPDPTAAQGKVESEVQPVIRKGGDESSASPSGSPDLEGIEGLEEPAAVPPAEQLETFNVVLNTSTDKVIPGQTMTVSGSGLRPNTGGSVLWQSTGTNAFTQEIGKFTADGGGNFSTEVSVPPDADRVLNSFGFPNTLAVSQTWGFGNAYPSPTLELVLDKIVETIFLALMGTTFAIVLSIPLSFLASRNLMPHTFLGTAVYTIARTVLNILRSIEVLILAIIFAATVGLGPFAGVLALTVHSIASLGKLYSEAIESIDPGPIEAVTATGANRLQVIAYAVVPQFIPQFISFTLYRWDINVRMSTIIGFVGGGGIGFILGQFINLGDYHKAATAIWAIAIVVIAMDYASAKIRAKVI